MTHYSTTCYSIALFKNPHNQWGDVYIGNICQELILTTSLNHGFNQAGLNFLWEIFKFGVNNVEVCICLNKFCVLGQSIMHCNAHLYDKLTWYLTGSPPFVYSTANSIRRVFIAETPTMGMFHHVVSFLAPYKDPFPVISPNIIQCSTCRQSLLLKTVCTYKFAITYNKYTLVTCHVLLDVCSHWLGTDRV